MDAKEQIICPVCQHVNPPDAVQCAECQVSLNVEVSTMQVPDSLRQIAVAAQEQAGSPYARNISPDDVVFYVAGEIQPLVIRGEGSELILGRSVGDAPSFVVDMTQFHGHLLGVSRNHALLTRTNEGYMIEDLESTNGTWLNDTRLIPRRLYPIESGAQLRLGQLVLFIYFSTPAA